MRAAYETSKALGGHALVFGRLHRAPTSPFVDVPIGTTTRVPSEAIARSVLEAESIMTRTVPVFGRSVPLKDPHTAPDTGGRWAQAPWWKVDIRSEDRLADVKWTWEVGRHRHLLVVARAAASKPDRADFRDFLVEELQRWLNSNAPEQGVHWYSNLEISLRALTWLQILTLTGERLPPEVRRSMIDHLHHSGRHLIADLPYTVSSMRNNHMLGDALGLLALGRAFGRSWWWSVGDRLFTDQLRRHMRPDGSMVEDSLSYHRFVTEMLAVRMLLGRVPSAVTAALQGAGAHLVRLGVFDGAVPQYGDWDEGRVLASSGDPSDVAGAAALALSLSGTGSTEDWRSRFDECAWYVSDGQPAPMPSAPRRGEPAGGGFARAEEGQWVGWLKSGGGTSHQHADLCSTALRIGPRWVVGDPGTGTYNGPLEQRNGFRTSSAHSVLRLQAADQLVPHRAFRWQHAATGSVGPAPVVSGMAVMWGMHDAYTRLGAGRVARLVVLRPGCMSVADVMEVSGQAWTLTLPFHPDVEVDAEHRTAVLPGGGELALHLPEPPVATRGQAHPYSGWWSSTYGSAVPATWLTMGGSHADRPVVWSVHEPSVTPAEGTKDGLRVEGIRLGVTYTAQGAVLSVDGDGHQQVLWTRPAR